MQNRAQMLQEVLGKLQMIISDLLKQLTGMDLQAYFLLLPGRGAAIQQLLGKIIMLIGSIPERPQ